MRERSAASPTIEPELWEKASQNPRRRTRGHEAEPSQSKPRCHLGNFPRHIGTEPRTNHRIPLAADRSAATPAAKPSNETQDQLPRTHCGIDAGETHDGKHQERKSQACSRSAYVTGVRDLGDGEEVEEGGSGLSLCRQSLSMSASARLERSLGRRADLPARLFITGRDEL